MFHHSSILKFDVSPIAVCSISPCHSNQDLIRLLSNAQDMLTPQTTILVKTSDTPFHSKPGSSPG